MKERKRMYERISDIGNRQILVNKLKNKINKEIKIQRKNHNELYKYNDDKDYVVNQIIKEEFAMIKLKEYLDYEYSFMDYSIKYYDKDVVINRLKDEPTVFALGTMPYNRDIKVPLEIKTIPIYNQMDKADKMLDFYIVPSQELYNIYISKGMYDRSWFLLETYGIKRI